MDGMLRNPNAVAPAVAAGGGAPTDLSWPPKTQTGAAMQSSAYGWLMIQALQKRK